MASVFVTNEEYDPVTNSWTDRASLPVARWGVEAAEVGGRIYVIGGTREVGAEIQGVTTNEEFTPEFLYVHRKN